MPGVPFWVRVWFNTTDSSAPIMQYSDVARAFIGEHVNPQFDLDYSGWAAAQPTTPPPLTCFDSGGS